MSAGIRVVAGDITRLEADAIVNAAAEYRRALEEYRAGR